MSDDNDFGSPYPKLPPRPGISPLEWFIDARKFADGEIAREEFAKATREVCVRLAGENEECKYLSNDLDAVGRDRTRENYYLTKVAMLACTYMWEEGELTRLAAARIMPRTIEKLYQSSLGG